MQVPLPGDGTSRSAADGAGDAIDLAAAYGELQNLLLASSDVPDFLQQLAGLCVAVVPATSCGITMRGDRETFTVASSHELARTLDEIQYGRGHGPCLHALHTGKRIIVRDLSTDDRWPDFGSHALTWGILSSLSLPLTVNGNTVCAMNLYGTAVDQFGPGVVDRADAFTRQATTALTIMLRHAEQVTVEGQLREALEVRAIIDQAIGILMGQQKISSTDAFGILREASQHRNIKLSVIAGELIAMVSGHPPRVPRPFTRRD
jgi:GAF domain-containing protein